MKVSMQFHVEKVAFQFICLRRKTRFQRYSPTFIVVDTFTIVFTANTL